MPCGLLLSAHLGAHMLRQTGSHKLPEGKDKMMLNFKKKKKPKKNERQVLGTKSYIKIGSFVGIPPIQYWNDL